MSFNYVEQTMERVLVIDDDVGLCELVGEYLQPEAYTVEAIHNGERGIDRALAGEHDLVVLDVMLPGTNGFDVLRRIRAKSRIPVLMLTARGDDVDRIVGLEIERMIIYLSLSIRVNWLPEYERYCDELNPPSREILLANLSRSAILKWIATRAMFVVTVMLLS
jgi:CheY-like chemotaxis protein